MGWEIMGFSKTATYYHALEMDTDHAYDEAMYMSVRLVDMNTLYT